MKEIGNPNASKAVVFCANIDCNLNSFDTQRTPVEEAFVQAKRHDALEGHEAVVVKYDEDYPLATEDCTETVKLTGMLIHC